MKQLLKEYSTPQDVFIIGVEIAKGIYLSDEDCETLWIQFPDRIERMYLDTLGEFEILESINENSLKEWCKDKCQICVLEQFTGKLYIDVIGDVTGKSILRDDWNKEEYLINQFLPYDQWTDYPEFVLYVEGDYDDVYCTTLEKYLKNGK